MDDKSMIILMMLTNAGCVLIGIFITLLAFMHGWLVVK